jgi:hypothetical protein
MAALNNPISIDLQGNRRRANALAAGLLIVFAGALALVVGLLYVESQYQPQGSAFGTPRRIPACGRTYTGPGAAQSLAEVEAGTTQGYAPQILEPTVGDIPLGADVAKIRTRSGELVCDTVIFLHRSGDMYLPYGLEGGP